MTDVPFIVFVNIVAIKLCKIVKGAGSKET